MAKAQPKTKSVIVRAARLRGATASDYARSVVVSQARREVEEARARTILLAPDEQLAFWRALHESSAPTSRQRALGRVMRGES